MPMELQRTYYLNREGWNDHGHQAGIGERNQHYTLAPSVYCSCFNLNPLLISSSNAMVLCTKVCDRYKSCGITELS